jgi:hypothetical protein
MKKTLSIFLPVLVVIVILSFPFTVGSESSPFVPGNQEKALSVDREHLVFSVDENALAVRSIRFELAYINTQLKDPSALVSRLSLMAPKANAKEVLKAMKQRKEELTKKLLKYAKQASSGQKEKGNYPPPLARPFPPQPRGTAPQRMAAASIEDAMKELGWSTQQDTTNFSIPCELRKGKISVPGHFAIGEMEGGCENPSDCEGGMSYTLDHGVLPFYGKMTNERDEVIHYYFFGQLGYKFPAPLCDSRLMWQFQLGAGAGLSSDAGSSWVYLDCFTLEMEDAYGELPTLDPIIFAGGVLDINDNVAWEGMTPQTFSGHFNVKARKESALFVGLFVMIAANSGESITSGKYQIFNMIPSFSPGVRYLLEPHEPPM